MGMSQTFACISLCNLHSADDSYMILEMHLDTIMEGNQRIKRRLCFTIYYDLHEGSRWIDMEMSIKFIEWCICRPQCNLFGYSLDAIIMQVCRFTGRLKFEKFGDGMEGDQRIKWDLYMAAMIKQAQRSTYTPSSMEFVVELDAHHEVNGSRWSIWNLLVARLVQQ